MTEKEEHIIKVLRSIKKISVKNGGLDVWQDDDAYPSVINSYIPESFTYKLLCLIETELLEKKDETSPTVIEQ